MDLLPALNSRDMKTLLTGACGFVGSTVAPGLLAAREGLDITGLDNLNRAGSELNTGNLKKLGITLRHLDIRRATDLETLGRAD